VVEDTADGVLLRPVSVFKRTTLTDLANCLKWKGPAKSIEEMDAAVAKGAREVMNGLD